MKAVAASLVILAAAVTAVDGRIWTDTQGRTLDAEIVMIKSDRTVVLRIPQGKVSTLPFDTFSDSDVEYLEQLLERQERGELHPVSVEEMNNLFGIPIWKDDLLWDDSTETVAERLEMKLESRTDYMENYRTYPLGNASILKEPVYTTVLYGGSEFADGYAMVFKNTGDPVEINGSYRRPLAVEIEACGEQIHDTIASLLGAPERDSLGRASLREKVWRWDWNEHAIMLSLQEKKYVALRIMPTDRANNGGRRHKMSDEELKSRLAGCVTRRDNGDVVIGNIPMIDQGPKGYCSPATWERYLRYLDISADMYLLALAADTTGSRGTYSPMMIQATRNIVSSNGRKLTEIDKKPTIDLISKYIDMGLPIMWRMISTPDFRKAIHENTAIRKGDTPEAKNFGGGAGGHICLIIGYNRQTEELAISDSWGPDFAERWVKLTDVRRVSIGNLSVIRW